MLCLEAFWQRLQKVERMSIQSHSGQAYGNALIAKATDTSLILSGKGRWVDHTSRDLDFSTALRWSIDTSAGVVGLEHLHYGPTRPVFLFHLAPTGPKTLQSIDSHFCLSDCYSGQIEFSERHIRFLWRILGPKKNEVLYHIYI